MFTINCKGKLLSLETPVVMGILNATPDSFYKGYLAGGWKEKLRQMVEEGASIIDIGGQSTRPGSQRLPADEELQRIMPMLEYCAKSYPEVIISIDTYHSTVAETAINAGAHIVNDISGGNMDVKMIATVARLQVPYICMHMQGTPETMQANPVYTNIVQELLEFFRDKISACSKAGITDVIIDPGFGFGKTIDQNFWLLKNLPAFQITGRPILAGLSRKSSIYKTLDIPVEESLNGSTVMHTLALQNGAHILRVHDVKEAVQAITLLEKYKKAAS